MTIDAPIDMEAFENAIHAWFSTATGLETIWANQSAPQPEYPFATLEITSGPAPAAPGWNQKTDFDDSRPAGKEVRVVACVDCTFNISCQVYVGMPDGRNPSKNAMQHLNKAQAALQLPTFQDALAAANVAFLRADAPQNLTELIDDAFVSRGNMDAVFGATLSAEEYAGYIDKAEISKTNPPTFDLLVDAS